ncbi:MAG: hypothetical protein Q7V01_13795 [Vicinamibacterales bacterium]|nr:hypothetical protein [Vicinamibacterales bacterium]
MNAQPAQRAVTTMASPMIIGRDEPFVVKLVFVVVALAIGLMCFAALLALASAVMPKTAARCKTVIGRWPVQALAAGLLTYVVGGGLAWYFLSHGYIPRLLKVQVVMSMLVPGLCLAALLLLLTVIGATGTVRFLGERLTGSGTPVTPLREILTGTLAATLASWFPIVGWVIVLPGLLFVSTGALIIGWVRTRQLT